MSSNNASPALIAGGDVYISRFVKLSTTADNTALQAGANERSVGISHDGTRDAPGVTGATADLAASAGKPVKTYGLGDICLLWAGSGGFTAGDQIKSDADGKGVTAGSANDQVGAEALQTVAWNERGRVRIVSKQRSN